MNDKFLSVLAEALDRYKKMQEINH